MRSAPPYAFAHNNGALVYVDDAGGTRVGLAAFGNPRTLELGATGFDKYGPKAPRFGLLAGSKDPVSRTGSRVLNSVWKPGRCFVRAALPRRGRLWQVCARH